MDNNAANWGEGEGLDFINLFCQKFGCPEAKFEKLLFQECLYPEGKDLARLLRVFRPGLFAADFELIEGVKHTTSFLELKKQVDFYAAQTSHEGGLRVLFKMRLSKSRLLNLAKSLFAATPAGPRSS